MINNYAFVLDRVLEVQVAYDVTKEGVAAVRKLKSLQEFIFTNFTEWNLIEQENLLGMCYELLPHLHVVAYTPEPFFDNTTIYLLSCLSSEALEEVSKPCTLQLRHLALETLNSVPAHVSLPQVQQLYLVRHPRDLNPLFASRFPSLTELNMHETNNKRLMNIVGHGLGQQLKALRVSFNEKALALQLDKVLDVCPNLSELFVERTEIQSAAELRPDTLGHLRILHSKRVKMQPSLLLQLLRLAPELRAVELQSDILVLADLEELTEMVEEGACLRHLERLEVALVPTATNFTEQWQRQLDMLIVSCSTHCEQLREFNVNKFLIFQMNLNNYLFNF
jgi:hypothetical protein